jgi:uncharacterized repeat protein (TIGR01451 family)
MNSKRVGCVVGAVVSFVAVAVSANPANRAQRVGPGSMATASGHGGRVVVGRSVRNDISPPLRTIPAVVTQPQSQHVMPGPVGQFRRQLVGGVPGRVDVAAVAPSTGVSALAMPGTILNFDGIPFPGVSCACAPPSPVGAAGSTQYVQAVNDGFQVFDKSTGASLLGPLSLESIWSGFGGVCEADGRGYPMVLYDRLANRWVIAEFAGTYFTDECVAVSTSGDATGSFFRYDFHLGSNFFIGKLSVWPDAYYLGTDVWDPTGTTYIGPQPWALDRAKMLVGSPATTVSPGIQSKDIYTMLPGDLDGAIAPPPGAPNPWLAEPGPDWLLYRFHPDFATPANTTFTLAADLLPTSYGYLCEDCVPQLNSSDNLETASGYPGFRLAYRRFADGHEALVGNLGVPSGGVAGIRWFEINNATSGTPSLVQQSTYQPDTTWRWMGSAAMDNQGNLALGFSASSAVIYPEIRYAGRLASDPADTLGQGEATLFAGTGSQTDTSHRWGDYTDLTVDPVDDCTFWYTNEYYATTDHFNWRTRIGSFKFSGCTPAQAVISGTKTVSGSFKPGGAITYTVVLSNMGNRDQADNPGHEFTDVLPAALSLVGASSTSGTAVATVATNTVTWDGAIPAGGTVTIAIDATVKNDPTFAGTAVANQGTISFDADGNGTNESSAVTDDPATPGSGDPTVFDEPASIPTLSTLALVILAVCVLAAGLFVSRLMA